MEDAAEEDDEEGVSIRRQKPSKNKNGKPFYVHDNFLDACKHDKLCSLGNLLEKKKKVMNFYSLA